MRHDGRIDQRREESRTCAFPAHGHSIIETLDCFREQRSVARLNDWRFVAL